MIIKKDDEKPQIIGQGDSSPIDLEEIQELVNIPPEAKSE